jgi:hypothetical protein
MVLVVNVSVHLLVGLCRSEMFNELYQKSAEVIEEVNNTLYSAINNTMHASLNS